MREPGAGQAHDAPLSVVIAEDEPLAREGLRQLLREDPEVQVVGEARGGNEAVALLRRLRPALCFLDVQMPELDGFAVLRALAPGALPAVVFVTAHDRYALRAFEVHALDYLLKPFDDERFAAALARAKQHLRLQRVHALAQRLRRLLGEPPDEAPAPGGGLASSGQRLAIKDAGRVLFLCTTEIDWIEAADYYVQVHAGGQVHLHRESMQRLAAQLDPQRFVRIHRSAIVNWDRVREVRSQGREVQVHLRDGTALRVARSHRDRIDRFLGA